MPLLSKGSKPIIGLNIGSKHIKAVEIRNAKGQLELLGAGVRPTPEGVISNGIIVDPGLLGAEVRELLDEAGIKGKRVVSSVAGQQSLVVRIIEVPRMTATELKETMRWEIERHIPFPAEDVVMDFQPLERAGEQESEGEAEGETMEVLLAVAQEEMINAHVAALEQAGLVPAAIDIEPLAVARTLAVLDENGGEDQTVALINVGARVTDISVVEGADLTFTRSVPVGGENLTLAISEQLGLQPEEAERAKCDMGSAIPVALAAGAAGVDSMVEMQVAGEEQAGEESPFTAFEFDAEAVDAAPVAEESTLEIPSESDQTDDVPEFDLSLGAVADDTAAEATTDTTGELPSFDLSLDDTGETEAQPETATAETEAAALDFSLDLDQIELVAGEPAPAAAEPDGTLDLSLDDGNDTAEATISLDDEVDVPAGDPPPALDLDLGAAPEEATETTGGLELDVGAADEDQPPAADGESTLALDGSELDTGLAPSEGEGEAPIGAFELDMGPGTPEAEGEADSPGAFELDMGPSPEDTDPEQTVGVELDFGGAAATETETEGDAEGGLGVFDLAVEDTEPDTEETGGFSFDLEEPSSEDDAPGVVGVAVEQDAEAAAATEDETSGGLMDLDDLAGLAELGTAGGEVTQDSLYAAISPVINELLTETRRSLEYYTSRYQGAAIDKVLLMGGTARLRGLAEVMASELGLTVEAADLFSKLSYSPKCEIAPEYVDEMSPALSVGLGLAIREMVEG